MASRHALPRLFKKSDGRIDTTNTGIFFWMNVMRWKNYENAVYSIEAYMK